jgi:hypothetical protein
MYSMTMAVLLFVYMVRSRGPLEDRSGEYDNHPDWCE